MVSRHWALLADNKHDDLSMDDCTDRDDTQVHTH